jgi:hypothetical protein
MEKETNEANLFNESAASCALSPTYMLTSDTASVTDDDPAALPVKGAASPDEDSQLSISTRDAVYIDMSYHFARKSVLRFIA